MYTFTLGSRRAAHPFLHFLDLALDLIGMPHRGVHRLVRVG
jgi:hypothetical protein